MQCTLAPPSCSPYVPFFYLHVYTLVTIYTYQAVKGVNSSHEALVDLLKSIEHFLKRLNIYSKISPTPAMTEIAVKIQVGLLSTLALATKQIQQGRLSGSTFAKGVPVSMQRRNFAKKLFWREGRRSGTGEATAAQTLTHRRPRRRRPPVIRARPPNPHAHLCDGRRWAQSLPSWGAAVPRPTLRRRTRINGRVVLGPRTPPTNCMLSVDPTGNPMRFPGTATRILSLSTNPRTSGVC